MGWITIYIQGKSGCTTEVLRNLEHSGIKFMPGSVSGEKNVALFWVDETVSERAFKKAIGSKTVFKYRLRVFTSLEKLAEFQGIDDEMDVLTPEEESMIREMHETHHYKHSA